MTHSLWRYLPGHPPPRYRFRPRIEGLESRLVPSTCVVTDLGDEGVGFGHHGDLRYCIAAANADAKASDRIVFRPGLTGTITLTRGELDVTKSLEIDGPGADRLTISGDHRSGVFALTNDPRLQDFRLAGVTVADGTGVLDPFFGNFHAGGGLYDYSPSAAVTLTRCTFADNAVSGPVDFGGALAMGNGTLVLDSCTFIGNSAGQSGGAIALPSNSVQATLVNCTLSGNTALEESAIYNNGTLTLDHCTVANNVASSIGIYRGDAILNGGGRTLTITHSRVEANEGSAPSVVNNASRMVITDSTIADNQGGGLLANYGSMTISGTTVSGNVDLHNYAGGLFAFDVSPGSDLEIANSTISGNTSTAVGGIRLFSERESLEMTSCTLTNNAGVIGGLQVFRNNTTAARAVVRNTIIAGNDGNSPDVAGPVISLGYNLIGQTDDSTGWGATDLTGTSGNPLDPQLSPLQNNGGPTLTHAPAITSPAHLRGDWSLLGSFDQRGTPRHDLLAPPDIGAVTFDQPLHLAIQAPDQVTAGEPFDLTVVALDNWGNRAYTYQGIVQFSSSDPDARLPANYRFRPDDWGAHSFTVTLNTAGSQTIQVVDTLGFPSGTTAVDVQEGNGPPGFAAAARDWLSWQADSQPKHRPG